MAEWSTVDCDEMEGTREESGSLAERSASVVLRCAYADRYALINDTVAVARIWPFETPSDYAMRAVDYSIETLGPLGTTPVGSPQLMDYELALITLNYRPAQVPSGPSPYTAFSETLRPSVERERMATDRLSWDPASGQRSLQRDEAPSIGFGRMEFVRTYFNWMGPFPTEYLSYQDTCNDAPVTSNILNLTFAAETLAFEPGQAIQTFDTQGQRTATVEMVFKYKFGGWNKFLESSTGAYWDIYRTDYPNVTTRITPFVLADYTQILL